MVRRIGWWNLALVPSLLLGTAAIAPVPARAAGLGLAPAPGLTAQAPDEDDEQRGLVGIYIFEDDETPGGAKVEKVKDGSPAARAGLKPGDVVVAFNGEKVASSAALARRLARVRANEEIKLGVEREGWRRDFTLTAAPRPAEAVAEKPYLGIAAEDAGAAGVKVTEVTAGSPAEQAGLKAGDLIVRPVAKGAAPQGFHLADLAKLLEQKKPGEEVTFRVERDGWQKDVTVKLGAKKAAPGRTTTEERKAPSRPETAKGEKKPGFLGVYLKDSDAGLAVENALPGSPAERAGLKQGDVIVAVAGHPVRDLAGFTDALGGYGAGDAVKLAVRRDGWTRTVDVTLGERPSSTSGAAPKPEERRPKTPAETSEKPAFLGIAVEEVDLGDGARGLKIVEVVPGSPAAKAGLKTGQVLKGIDRTQVASIADLAEALKARKAGDTIVLEVNDGSRVKVTLAPRED
jgi:S1-C subfamily serine protease